MRRIVVFLLGIMLLSGIAPVAAQDDYPVITPENAAQLELIASYGRGIVQDVAWSPTGDVIAVGVPDGIWLYNPADLTADARFIPYDYGWLNTIAFSPDGQVIAAGGDTGIVGVYVTQTGERLARLEDGLIILDLAFNPDGYQLAVASNFAAAGREMKSGVSVWDMRNPVRTGLPEAMVQDSAEGTIISLAYSADGALLASSWTNQLRVRDMITGEERMVPLDIPRALSLTFNGMDGLVLGSMLSGTLVYDPYDLAAPPRPIPATTDPVLDLAAVPTGDTLAIGTFDAVYVWADDTVITALLVNGSSVAFDPTGAYVLVGGATGGAAPGGVAWWDVTTGEQIAIVPGHTEAPIRGLAFAPETDRLFIGYSDGMLRAWDVWAENTPVVWGKHGGSVVDLALSADGSWLVSAGASCACSADADHNVRVWDVSTRQPVALWLIQDDTVEQVAISADGTTVAAGTFDGAIYLWDRATGEPGPALAGHGRLVSDLAFSPIADLAFSPDGTLLASSGFDETVNVWDVATGERHATISVINGTDALAFSPDGQQLALGAFSGVRIITWDVAALTGRVQVEDASSHMDVRGALAALTYSPNGQLLAADRTEAFFTYDIAGEGTVFSAFAGKPNAIAFNAAGTLIATGGDDGVVRVWAVPGE